MQSFLMQPLTSLVATDMPLTVKGRCLAAQA
jgi:hypothetical protein